MPLRIQNIAHVSFNSIIESIKTALSQDLKFYDYPVQNILPGYNTTGKHPNRVFIETDGPGHAAALQANGNEIIFSIETENQLSLSIYYRESCFDSNYVTGLAQSF